MISAQNLKYKCASYSLSATKTDFEIILSRRLNADDLYA